MLLEELNSLEINDKLNIVPMLSTESTISKNGLSSNIQFYMVN